MEGCWCPEPEVGHALQPPLFPLLLQDRWMEEGKGGGGIYHKTIFEYQLGSSSEIPKVLRKVRTHVSFNPMPPPPPVRPGLAAFVCCFCCYSHLPVSYFLWKIATWHNTGKGIKLIDFIVAKSCLTLLRPHGL